jgi:hypothetical protein
MSPIGDEKFVPKVGVPIQGTGDPARGPGPGCRGQ